MPRKEFVIRGQTASGVTEVLNFGGKEKGYAYRLVDFELYPSESIGTQGFEMIGTVTAAKTAVAPTDPNFNDEGLIATCYIVSPSHDKAQRLAVINDKFLITQDLVLMVQDIQNAAVNWQCRFVMEKMTGPEEAATNYKQFTISDA
jgi:hypothetical protein